MSLIDDCKKDLFRLRTECNVGNTIAILANRGFHALFFYRLAHSLNRKRIPLLPLVLSRIVQILYAIDIDYKAELEGGIMIIHGVGVVIGQGAVIRSNTTIYHGVTLGRKKQGVKIPPDDGYPIISNNCVLGAGSKIIGPVTVGENSIVGPNCVVTNSIPPNSIFKFSSSAFSIKSIIPNILVNEDSHSSR